MPNNASVFHSPPPNGPLPLSFLKLSPPIHHPEWRCCCCCCAFTCAAASPAAPSPSSAGAQWRKTLLRAAGGGEEDRRASRTASLSLSLSLYIHVLTPPAIGPAPLYTQLHTHARTSASHRQGHATAYWFIRLSDYHTHRVLPCSLSQLCVSLVIVVIRTLAFRQQRQQGLYRRAEESRRQKRARETL